MEKGISNLYLHYNFYVVIYKYVKETSSIAALKILNLMKKADVFFFIVKDGIELRALTVNMENASRMENYFLFFLQI